MASPWKFLSRLVSPRRQQKQGDVPNDEANSDGVAIAGPPKTPAEENSADRPAGGESPQRISYDPVSADTRQLLSEHKVHFLRKPFSVQELLKTIDDLLSQDETLDS